MNPSTIRGLLMPKEIFSEEELVQMVEEVKQAIGRLQERSSSSRLDDILSVSLLLLGYLDAKRPDLERHTRDRAAMAIAIRVSANCTSSPYQVVHNVVSWLQDNLG